MPSIETNPLGMMQPNTESGAPPTQEPVLDKKMTLSQILASCDSSMPIGLQSAYAKTQLTQASLCKEQAQKRVAAIQEIQEKQAQISGMINKLRQNKTDGDGKLSPETYEAMKKLGISTDPPNPELWNVIKPGASAESLINYLQKAWEVTKPGSTERKWIDDWLPNLRKNASEGKEWRLTPADYANLKNTINRVADVHYRGENDIRQHLEGASGKTPIILQNNDQWEYNLKSMTNYQEQVGTKTQSHMVALQDFLGQYNSYLQGASAAIDKANQLLSKLASER